MKIDNANINVCSNGYTIQYANMANYDKERGWADKDITIICADKAELFDALEKALDSDVEPIIKKAGS